MADHHLRILHISDLHMVADEDWRRRAVLGDAWLRNLDDLIADGRPPDLVCFTGDLAKKGKLDEYVQAADILQARGQLDEALRIREEEELPVYERLEDVRSLLVGRANLAINHLMRGEPGDRAEAIRLLRLALAAARGLRIPETGQIEGILRQIGESP